MRTPSRPVPAARLGLELLESRLTPAGNLTAGVTEGTLHIKGDRFNHAFEVIVHDHFVRLLCIDATSINGVRNLTGFASADFPGGAGTISALVIEGNSSNDRITITDALTASRALGVTVRTSGAADWVTLSNGQGYMTGTVDVDTGGGNDTVSANGNWAGVPLGVYLGAGDDSLSITGSVGNITGLNGGTGKNDTITIPDALYLAFAPQITGFENITRT